MRGGLHYSFLVVAAKHLCEVQTSSCDALDGILARHSVGRGEGKTLTSPVDWACIMSSSGLSRNAMAFLRLSTREKSSFSTLWRKEGVSKRESA